MPSCHLTVVIPDLLPTLSELKNRGIEFKFPALSLFLARAASRPVSYKNTESLLFSLFELPITDELPVGAITGLADGLATEQNYWLRADPVEFRSDMAAVYFMGGNHLLLSSDEISVIANDLNSFLVQDGITLHTPTNTRWYFSLKDAPKINTSEPHSLLGKNIEGYLPEGEQKKYWRKLMTEVQMLLHNHPINQQRLKANEPPVNGLWFSGSGLLPAAQKSQWKKIMSNDVLLEGLAKLTLSSFDKNVYWDQMEEEGNYLIVNQLDYSENILKSLDASLFNPLLCSLRKKEISSITFYLGDKFLYHVTSKTIRYFWRRKKIQ